MNKELNIPTFYSELKINTVENSGFYIKKQLKIFHPKVQ